VPKVEIRSESCKSCGYCVKFCPRQVLAVGERVNSKGYEYVTVKNGENCVACKMCAVICPDAAIEIYK
jgi:2-oxoglutarate ferredoxin oxidoreductase subunit delta